MYSKSQIRLFLFAILILNYLLRVPWLIDEFHVPRFIFLSGLCALGLLWMTRKPKERGMQPLDLALVGFYVLNLISVSWAFNFGEAIFTAQKYYLLFLSYFIFRSILKDQQHWPVLANMITGLSLLTLLISSYELISYGMSEGFSELMLYKVIAHSGHKNLVASFLFLLLGLQVYFLINKQVKAWQYWLLGWQLIVILILRSRAVYLATAVFALVLGFYYFSGKKEWRQVILKRVLPFALATGLIGALVIANTGIGKGYLRYLNPTTYTTSVSGAERLFVWYKTRELIQDKLWLGHGAGSWKLVFPSKNISGGYRLQEKDTVFTRVHNDFLEVWCEVGLVGLLLYLSIFGMAIWALWGASRQLGTKQKNKLIVLLATLLGYLIISFFDFPKERMEHQILLALLLALSAVTTYPFLPNQKRIFRISQRRYLWLIGGLLSILLLHIPISYHRYIGDRNSREIIIALAIKNNKAVREQTQAAHSAWYDVNPLIIPLKWYEGMSYYYEKNFQAAQDPFAQAYAINPYNFNVINNYGSTLVQLQQFQQAIELYEQALKINPKFEEGMFNLSFAYYQLQQYDKAEEWVNRTSGNPQKKKLFLQRIREAKK